MKTDWQYVIRNIRPADQNAYRQAAAFSDSLVKPAGSLGKLETIAAQIASITGKVRGNTLKKRCIPVMCADNGVTEEGVCAAPQSVTLMMAKTMARGGSGMTVMAKEAGADVFLIDIGMNSDEVIPGFIQRKIMKGTRNIAKGPAMSRQDCIRAMETGMEFVCQKADEDYELFGTGELGMGNTSTSSAVLSALCGIPVSDVTGKGAGLTEQALLHKKEVIQRALNLNFPDANDPIDVISKVGGLDIAGLTGIYLGAAFRRRPVVIDGFISAAAALAACRLCPHAADYMIPSHCSAEPGYAAVMRELKKEPLLMLDMRLGEGSGCPLAFRIIDQALAVINNMMTFQEAAVDNSALVDIREKN